MSNFPAYHLNKILQESCQSLKMAESLGDWRCGVFDGGCLLVALALQRTLGTGDLFALYTWLEVKQIMLPQHIVLRVGDWYLDGDGVSGFDELIAHWKDVECIEIDEVAPITIEEALHKECGVYSDRVLQTISDLFIAAIPEDLIAWIKERHTSSEWHYLQSQCDETGRR